MHTIVIAGGSGFIGAHLAAAFRADGDEVRSIGRSRADATWGDPAGIAATLEGADLLVNLAGRSVNCRYNAANRAEILRSGGRGHGVGAGILRRPASRHPARRAAHGDRAR